MVLSRFVQLFVAWGLLQIPVHDLLASDFETSQWLDQADPDEVFDMIADQWGLKPLEEILGQDYLSLSQKDRDQIALMTGEMSPQEFIASHPPVYQSFSAQLTGIAESIWGAWQKVEIPGAVCSDGSPYKIFVQKARGKINKSTDHHKNLIIYLEPGGACWDYKSCSGNSLRGARNPNGIPDNYMSISDWMNPMRDGGSINALISPMLSYNNPTGYNLKTSRWNKVFLPYCTGDVFLGDKVATYTNPENPKEKILYRHNGYKNMKKVIEYLQTAFRAPKDMMVSGCSAGATGAMGNYHFIRKGLKPEKSYLISDSGPIFHAPGKGNHWPLHKQIKKSWNIDSAYDDLTDDYPEYKGSNNYGIISEALAKAYPNDIIATTLFRRDAIYSSYSYSHFFNLDESKPEDLKKILDMWEEDVNQLKKTYDRHQNLIYYIPYMRPMARSHCTTIITFNGTQIHDGEETVGDFILDVIDQYSSESAYEGINDKDKEVSDFWMRMINSYMDRQVTTH